MEFTGSRLAFYIGVLCMILAAISVPLEWHFWGVTPAKLLQSADTWFLITIVMLLHSIEKKVSK
ncbi:MAG: hypothetical protein V1495_05850 [Pseudomonadota bacterium]